MNIQLIVNIVIIVGLLIWAGYTMFTFFMKREKSKQSVLDHHHIEEPQIIDMRQSTFNESNIEEDATIYLEQGNRTFSFELILTLQNKEPYQQVFYGYVDSISRDTILDKYFFVNDREVLLKEEDGDHYYNQNRIEEILFNCRKIIPAFSEETEQVTDETVSEANPSNQIEESDLEKIVEQEISSNDESLTNESEMSLESTSETQEPDKSGLNIEQSSTRNKFTKKQKESFPTLKKVSAKTFNRWFLVGMVLFLLVAPYGLVRTFGISNRIDRMERSQLVSSKNKENPQALLEKQADVYRLNHFMTDFLKEFIPTFDDSDKIDAKNKALESYFASNVTYRGVANSEERQFVSADLIDWSPEKNVSNVSYNVTYTISNKEDKATSDKTQSEVITINYIDEGKGYSIVALPSFTKDKRLVRYSDGVTVNEEGKALAGAKQDDVTKFTELFLTKYATGTNEELKYYMSHVEAMANGYELSGIDSISAYESKGGINVYVQAKFKNSETKIEHQESFSLRLKETEKQFKIEQLNHYLGGL